MPITDYINAISSTRRQLEEVKKRWQDLKRRTKEKENTQKERQGAGPPEVHKLTTMQEVVQNWWKCHPCGKNPFGSSPFVFRDSIVITTKQIHCIFTLVFLHFLTHESYGATYSHFSTVFPFAPKQKCLSKPVWIKPGAVCNECL